MGGSLLFKTEVPGSSLLGHLPKEFSLRLTWYPWLVRYYCIRMISRGVRKLVRTPSLSKKKKKKNYFYWQKLTLPVKEAPQKIRNFTKSYMFISRVMKCSSKCRHIIDKLSLRD